MTQFGPWSLQTATISEPQVQSVLTKIKKSEDIPDDEKNKVEAAFNYLRDKGFVKNPLDSDIWVYRSVVIIFGVAIIIVVISSCILSFFGKGGLPEGIIAIASAAVGALAGLFFRNK